MFIEGIDALLLIKLNEFIFDFKPLSMASRNDFSSRPLLGSGEGEADVMSMNNVSSLNSEWSRSRNLRSFSNPSNSFLSLLFSDRKGHKSVKRVSI